MHFQFFVFGNKIDSTNFKTVNQLNLVKIVQFYVFSYYKKDNEKRKK